MTACARIITILKCSFGQSVMPNPTYVALSALGLIMCFSRSTSFDCASNDENILRQSVYICSEMGADGKWVTHAHGFKVYQNDTTLSRDLQVDFEIRQCGKKAEVLRNDSDSYPVSDEEYLDIISPKEWNAKDLSRELKHRFERPPSTVIIGDTQSRPCTGMKQCTKILRGRQNRPKYGIFANFIVGGGGLIFEGRGWDYESGRKDTFVIDVIGFYIYEYPPKVEMDACLKILQQGVRMGKIDKQYKVHMGKDIAWGDK